MERFTFASRYCEAGRLLGAVLGRPLLGPRAVSLEITHHCNLHCVFCESHGRLQNSAITARREYAGGRRVMDPSTVGRLAVEFAHQRVDLVQLSGKGDPIAHPEMTEIIRLIKETGVACALVTNATLAGPGLAADLVEMRLDRLTVSLNAGTREAYFRTCGVDLFDKAVALVRAVTEYKRDAGRYRPWVRISHVVCRENMDDFENMARIGYELGVDEVVWTPMSALPETAHLSLTPADAARVVESAVPWENRLNEAGIVHNLGEFLACVSPRADNVRTQADSLQRSIPCYEGWFFCVIAPDGAVVPCCYCEEEVMGNIHDRSFGEIWRGGGYKRFRRDSLSMPRTGRPICAECYTTCNRAIQNLQVFRRTHPLDRGAYPQPEASGKARV